MFDQGLFYSKDVVARDAFADPSRVTCQHQRHIAASGWTHLYPLIAHTGATQEPTLCGAGRLVHHGSLQPSIAAVVVEG